MDVTESMEVETWRDQLIEIIDSAESHRFPSELPDFPYHSSEAIQFVRELNWDIVKQEYKDEKRDLQELLLKTLDMPMDTLSIIQGYSDNLFEGYWYTSGELFLKQFSPTQFVGLFFGYIVIGELAPHDHDIIYFHQYPCIKFKQRVTVQGTLDETHQNLESRYILGKRPPWRPLTIVRKPPSFQRALIYAAEGNIPELENCFNDGYEINFRFDEFQKSTVLDIATVHNQPAMVEYLLQRGADANIKNDSGSTPLGIARAKDYLEVVEIFERYNVRQ